MGHIEWDERNKLTAKELSEAMPLWIIASGVAIALTRVAMVPLSILELEVELGLLVMAMGFGTFIFLAKYLERISKQARKLVQRLEKLEKHTGLDDDNGEITL